jgi:tetratricopeptide (TPR) repeat protein
MRGCLRMLAVAAVFLCMASPDRALATSAEPAKEPPVDPASCAAAVSAADDDKILTVCGALIDNDKTARADRIKALIARGGVFGRRDQIDRAIADYDSVLRFDATLADIYNARGELWRKKGDRPKALQDFGAAIKLNPDQQAARANYKSLAQELERLGALMAVAGKPSFNCATARRPVEKAICANPELADLDREINAASIKAVRAAAGESPSAGRVRQREQDEFIARRNASFGHADYDLMKAMRERLEHLQAIERN